MSAGYASRLSEYSNKGACGLPETYESKRALSLKLKKLATMVNNSHHLVILTGAGISTGAGIPDFRGPKGVWTMEKQEKKRAKMKDKGLQSKLELKDDNQENSKTNNKRNIAYANGNGKRSRANKEQTSRDGGNCGEFASALPTFTHRAITRLAQDDVLKYCVTQNVDGLHRRSGLKRSRLSVLHGCVFTEKCDKCDTEHFREYDVGGMSFQLTGRKCEMRGCKTGKLRDTLLDWEDALPDYDFERAKHECDLSDLVLCLGTSLRIEPAGSLPTLAQKFVVVNLQETPYDSKADLTIRAPVDDVMKDLIRNLGYKDGWEHEETPSIEQTSCVKELAWLNKGLK